MKSRLPREMKRKKTMEEEENHERWSWEGERDEKREKHERRREEDREFVTYLEMNERDYRRRRCTAIGHSLRLSTPSLLEVRFCFELFSQFVFAKVFNRDSSYCFKDYSGFFFFSVHGHINSHKVYAFFLERKRCDQSVSITPHWKRHTPFRSHVLFLTPQDVLAPPRP